MDTQDKTKTASGSQNAVTFPFPKFADKSVNPRFKGKPQAQHSPLPWRTVENYKGGIPLGIHSDENTCVARVDWLPDGSGRAGDKCTANARLIVRSVNHAGALAEALRDLRNAYQQMFDVMPVAWQTYDHIAEQALAKWEAGHEQNN